ncbi:MAG TPA: molybdopterin-synthase adenylyltransferase MoeB [Candidatus Thermoplasmatota archaeon]|jgi:adenylyltransferase/sulfurtransferase|nr:molybdopterin-synthase adenylyltransferase MoeB [Candidatus Thermoplasmatota archaeon]
MASDGPAPLPDVARRAALQGFSPGEVKRYARHVIMPEVGLEGQRRLKASKVLVIGSGGLGAPLIQYLAAAGVGTLGIVDFDVVDESNLQRQVLFTTQGIGKPKAEAAAAFVRALNPHVKVEVHATKLTSANALEILRPYDVVADGSDNFATRYLVNDACVLLGKPNVYGSIFRFEGQLSVFWAERGPCYRCLYPKPPPPGMVPSCAEGGVLGVLPGVVGAMQATEVVKLLTGAGDPIVGKLLLYDALSMEFTELKLRRDPACPACGTKVITKLIDYEEFCGERGQEVQRVGSFEIAPFEAQARIAQGAMLVDVREPGEWDIAHIEGATLIPLRTLPDRAKDLPQNRDIIVHCHSGARSAQAVQFLRRMGFQRVWNMTGGIDAWSQLIDPSVPQY